MNQEFIKIFYVQYTEFIFKNINSILLTLIVIIILKTVNIFIKFTWKHYHRTFWMTVSLILDWIFRTKFFYTKITGDYIDGHPVYNTFKQMRNNKFTWQIKDRARRRILFAVAKITADYFENQLKTNLPILLKYSIILPKRYVIHLILKKAKESYKNLDILFKKEGIPLIFIQKYKNIVALNRKNYESRVIQLNRSPDMITLLENYLDILDEYLTNYLQTIPQIVKDLNGSLTNQLFQNEFVDETKVNRMIRKFQIRYAILSNQIEICNDVSKVKKLIHAKNKISKAIESETSMEIYLFDLHNK